MTLRLDLGCGKHPKDGFLGVDARDYGRSDILVADLREPWKWEDESVDEVYCSHFIEHLSSLERVHFWNELYRVLKPGATAEIIAPHQSHGRSYGDPTHQWPSIDESMLYYLSRSWREENAPHTCDLFKCDLKATWGFRIDQDTLLRNQEFQQFASARYRNVCEDIVATISKPEAA